MAATIDLPIAAPDVYKDVAVELYFVLRDGTAGIDGESANLTCTISKGGAHFGSADLGTIVDEDYGRYTVELSANDTDTVGPLAIHLAHGSYPSPMIITRVVEASLTAAAIAVAVWDEDATAHQTLGTFGQAIGDPVADANTIFGAVVTGATEATIAADIIDIHAMVEGIAVTGSALSVIATSGLVTTGTEVNTYAATNLLDGIRHTITVVGTTIDAYWEFVLPNASSVPAAVDVAGWLEEGGGPGGDTVDMYAYNWGGAAFEVVSLAAFTGIITAGPNQNVSVDLLARHVEAGTFKVRIRLQKATLETGTKLNIDHMMVHYAEAIAANIALILADTDNIQTRIPAALSAGGNIKADVESINDVIITGNGSPGSKFGV